MSSSPRPPPLPSFSRCWPPRDSFGLVGAAALGFSLGSALVTAGALFYWSRVAEYTSQMMPYEYSGGTAFNLNLPGLALEAAAIGLGGLGILLLLLYSYSARLAQRSHSRTLASACVAALLPAGWSLAHLGSAFLGTNACVFSAVLVGVGLLFILLLAIWTPA